MSSLIICFSNFFSSLLSQVYTDDDLNFFDVFYCSFYFLANDFFFFFLQLCVADVQAR